ncbi:hypothetical protein [Aphanothece sacrum]|nr:hypothetical protein [Aphanothece sacrum]GBF86068.1 hypothetical protein AsFPU3_3138 [Aphanothece sacrum FPU3]
MTNSGSNLREDGNNLVKLNYSDILNKIIEVLQSDKSEELFQVSDDGKRLLMNVDEIAYQVACLPIESLFTGRTSGTKCASINFLKGLETQFSEQLHTIQDRVKFLLEEALPKQENQTLSIQEYINIIATPLTNLKVTEQKFSETINKKEISFNYPFEKQYTNLQKQRLTLPKDNLTTSPLLRLHKLTITIKKPTIFVTELKNSLQNYINNEERFNEDERETLQDILDGLFENQEQEGNHIFLLKKLMTEEALGKLKKTASIKYLEFLYKQVKHEENAIYLKDLIRRLKIIEQYINDENKPDNYYKVYYQGVEVDYQEFF